MNIWKEGSVTKGVGVTQDSKEFSGHLLLGDYCNLGFIRWHAVSSNKLVGLTSSSHGQTQLETPDRKFRANNPDSDLSG